MEVRQYHVTTNILEALPIITLIETLKDNLFSPAWKHWLRKLSAQRIYTYTLCHEFGRSQDSKQDRKQFPSGAKDPSSCKAISATTLQRILHNHNSQMLFFKPIFAVFVMCWETLGTMIYCYTFLWIFIKCIAKYLHIL